MKYYRDIKNVVDTSREEGILEGMEKGIEKRTLEIAKEMKDSNLDIKLIEEITGLSSEEIRKL